MSENLKSQPDDFEYPKGEQSHDTLIPNKPDEQVNNNIISETKRSTYVQLDFFQVIDQSFVVSEHSACGYEQLELPIRRPLRKHNHILELIKTIENGRPSQKAEARYRLEQILEQNENRILRDEIREALASKKKQVSNHILPINSEPETLEEISFLEVLCDKFIELVSEAKLSAETAIAQLKQFYKDHELQFTKAQIFLNTCAKKFLEGAEWGKDKFIALVNGIFGVACNGFRIMIFLLFGERATQNFSA